MENFKAKLNKMYDIYESKISVPLAIILILVCVSTSYIIINDYVINNKLVFYANNVYTYCGGITNLDESKMKDSRDLLLTSEYSTPEIKQLVEIGDNLVLTKVGVKPKLTELKELIGGVSKAFNEELMRCFRLMLIAVSSAFLLLVSVVIISINTKNPKLVVFNSSVFVVFTLCFLALTIVNYDTKIDCIPIVVGLILSGVTMVMLYFNIRDVKKSITKNKNRCKEGV